MSATHIKEIQYTNGQWTSKIGCKKGMPEGICQSKILKIWESILVIWTHIKKLKTTIYVVAIWGEHMIEQNKA